MTDFKIVTAYAVRNTVYPTIYAAEAANHILYKKKEQIHAVIAVEFQGRIFPTNPLIIISEK